MSTNHRRRPLHTCAASFLAIATKAYSKAEHLNAPLWSLTKKIAANSVSVASPIVRTLQCQFLAMLLFLDDRIILPLESAMEAIFPPWKYLFDKVDEIVEVAESLPRVFDDVAEKIPAIFHQVPLLNSGIEYAISWLSVLTDCGNGSAKEKEIRVDFNCNESNDEPSNGAQLAEQGRELPELNGDQVKEDPIPVSVSPGVEAENASAEGTRSDEVSPRKLTYKDALEKGRKEDADESYTKGEENGKLDVSQDIVQESEVAEKAEKSMISPEKNGEKGGEGKIKKDEKGKEEMENSNEKEKGIVGEGGEEIRKHGEENMDDPVLALFESVWLMKQQSKGKGNSISRSVSYQF